MENKEYVEIQFVGQDKVKLEVSAETILKLVDDFNYLDGQYYSLYEKYEDDICHNEECELKRHGFGKKE